MDSAEGAEVEPLPGVEDIVLVVVFEAVVSEVELSCADGLTCSVLTCCGEFEPVRVVA